ncbi:hypothetical protein PtB15_17B78 [Puccinia triticina]|nr:hypothetical protein PtB15_17B78 [Puccinia triticina]
MASTPDLPHDAHCAAGHANLDSVLRSCKPLASADFNQVRASQASTHSQHHPINPNVANAVQRWPYNPIRSWRDGPSRDMDSNATVIDVIPSPLSSTGGPTLPSSFISAFCQASIGSMYTF